MSMILRGHLTCRGRPDGSYPDLEDCSKFHICSNGIASSFSCSTGLLFDIKSLTCEWSEDATCAECPRFSYWSSCRGMCRKPSCDYILRPCPGICVQGCACDPGYVWYGEKCIPWHSCPPKGGQEGKPKTRAQTRLPTYRQQLPTKKTSSTSGEGYRRVCYYASWAQYRNDPYKFFPENLDADLCNFFIFAFAKIDEDNHLAPFDDWGDETMYRKLNDHVKVCDH
ncbi:CHIT1 [Branchiostoma lanceolatum]|uniref:chitinase n=1 Tax=Branchiostoma lanceolatum TaxID=7740 RepID=A0A8K0ENU7_BRALA|nr:CHIT1 [Branchiostoma lanceolatum]